MKTVSVEIQPDRSNDTKYLSDYPEWAICECIPGVYGNEPILRFRINNDVYSVENTNGTPCLVGTNCKRYVVLRVIGIIKFTVTN